MLVKADEKKLSFLFQEPDPFFEIGCGILEQEHINQMLPYKRKQQNGKEKLIFDLGGGNIVRLAEALPKFGEDDLVDLLYEMIYLIKKVEENGFLKKECIWFQYDNIYYDLDRNCIRIAILPITGELQYMGTADWYGHFEKTAENIIFHLPQEKAEDVRKIVMMLKSGKMGFDGALTELGRIGADRTSKAAGNSGHEQAAFLRLLYSGKSGRLEFLIGDDDFLIGRNAAAADGVIAAGLSKAVSRKHCLITKINHKYFVQDLKSVNHTLVNGIMIPPYELMELENNDILSVADIEFRVTTKTDKHYDK